MRHLARDMLALQALWENLKTTHPSTALTPSLQREGKGWRPVVAPTVGCAVGGVLVLPDSSLRSE